MTTRSRGRPRLTEAPSHRCPAHRSVQTYPRGCEACAAASRARRTWHKAAQRCSKCGNPCAQDVDARRAVCTACRTQESQRQHALRAQGQCTQCQGMLTPADAPHRRCARCLALQRARRRATGG